jgi:heme-degrading monooxygenase HmoA
MPSIMRIWRGEVSADRAAEYLERVTPIALADYKRIPGNRGAWVLSRSAGEVTQITTLSLWDSMTSICAFAGDPPDRAKYYNFDAEYLLSLSPSVEHWQVHGD